MDKKFIKRGLAILLAVALVFTGIDLSGLLDNTFYAATINDKSLNEFAEELGGLYEDMDISIMQPDVTFMLNDDTLVVDGDIMVHVDELLDNTDIFYAEIEDAIVEHEDQEVIAVEDIVNNSSYEIVQENENAITISKPYQSKTLIVKSPVKIDTDGAVTVISGYGDLYILKYDTEDDTEAAYNSFRKNRKIEYVEVDSMISAETIFSAFTGEDYQEESDEDSMLDEDDMEDFHLRFLNKFTLAKTEEICYTIGI